MEYASKQTEKHRLGGHHELGTNNSNQWITRNYQPMG